MSRRTPNEDVDDLIVRTREAHEALQDLKQTMKDVKEIIGLAKDVQVELLAACAAVVDDAIGDAVESGLRNYERSIVTSVETAENAVYQRFDVIASILLGEAEDIEAAARLVRKSFDEEQTLSSVEEWQMEQMQETLRRRISMS